MVFCSTDSIDPNDLSGVNTHKHQARSMLGTCCYLLTRLRHVSSLFAGVWPFLAVYSFGSNRFASFTEPEYMFLATPELGFQLAQCFHLPGFFGCLSCRAGYILDAFHRVSLCIRFHALGLTCGVIQ